MINFDKIVLYRLIFNFCRVILARVNLCRLYHIRDPLELEHNFYFIIIVLNCLKTFSNFQAPIRRGWVCFD